MIDLHSHSTASDGSLSPRALVALARDSGLGALALTDHDTLDGLPEASRAAAEMGIRFIPGIEIESGWPDRGVFHVLGLGFDPEHSAMRDIVPRIQELRAERNRAMLERMAAAGIAAGLDDIAAAGKAAAVITRPHFADYLIHIGAAKDRQQAFDKYLTPGKPFFVPYPGLPLAEIVPVIHAAGGKVVVAHPLSLYVSWTRLAALMRDWAAIGVDGVESWHPSAGYKDALRMDALAAEIGLRTSAGSDFHGDKRPDRVLGKTLEEKHRIEDRFLSLFD